MGLVQNVVVSAEPCVCHCNCEEHVRRQLQVIPDPTELLNDISAEINSVLSGLGEVKNYLVDLRDDVFDSAVNMSNKVEQKFGDVTMRIGDEFAAAQANIEEVGSSAINAVQYGFIGAIVGVLGVAILSAVVKRWCCKPKIH